MILRGDGKSGIIRADCFKRKNYPNKEVDLALLNPPFPHHKTDPPPTRFIDRALLSVRNKGMVASIVPYSLLVKMSDWHHNLLKCNRLLFVGTMPPDAFQPYASFNTAVVVVQKGVPHANSRVLFARLWNDGYKLKKNVRIPRQGSQVPAILEAFERKEAIPELTAYEKVDLDSKEWSPEAYIVSLVHSDDEFIAGFEQSIRKHAAFYIGEGHNIVGTMQSKMVALAHGFEGRSTVSFANVSFGTFRVDDYFTVQLGGKDEIEDLDDDGNIPIVSTSEFNNGVTAWKKPAIIYSPLAITVATDGSTGSSFVQEFPFYAFYKVALLRPKLSVQVPVDALYFVAYLIYRERWRYVYARKLGKTRLSATILHAPIRDGKPDFVKMAELTRQCVSYPIIAAFRDTYNGSVAE
jgi:hypothetical protein